MQKTLIALTLALGFGFTATACDKKDDKKDAKAGDEKKDGGDKEAEKKEGDEKEDGGW